MADKSGILQESVTSKAKRLIDGLRDFVLCSNSDGDFAKIGISPLIFAPDFDGRVESLVRLNEGVYADHKVQISYCFQRRMDFVDGFLRISIKHDPNTMEYQHVKQATVDLISFSRKAANDQFFEKLLPKLEAVLEEFFPNSVLVVMSQEKTLGDATNIPEVCSTAVRRRKPAFDSKLSEALKKYKSQKSRKKIHSHETPTEVVAVCSTSDATHPALPVAIPIGIAENEVKPVTEKAKKESSAMRYQQKMVVVILVAVAFFVWCHPASS